MSSNTIVKIAKIADFPPTDSVGFAPRDRQLSFCHGPEKHARQAVWLLLRQALAQFGTDEIASELQLSQSGKWVGKNVFVSLSHSKTFVAVAVSDSPVGIDVEDVDRNVSARLYKRIATAAEFSRLGEQLTDVQTLRLWTAKEAAYKLSDGQNVISQLDTSLFDIDTVVQQGYVLSVAHELCNKNS